VGTDTGTGADTSSRQGFYSVSDSGAGTETFLLIVSLSGADSGSETDSGSIIAGQSFIFGTDTGAGAELVYLLGKLASDSGVGLDQILAMGKRGDDSSSGSDTSNIGNSLFVSDQNSSADQDALIQAVINAVDTASDTEASSLNALTIRFGNDIGLGTDNGYAFEKIVKIVEQVLSAGISEGTLRKVNDPGELLKVSETDESKVMRVG
jgi:hypothetical protein